MSNLEAIFLPQRPEVTTEIYDIDTGNSDMPLWPGWIVGVQLQDGSYDPRWQPRITLTEEESWALAGVLSKASGYPVRGVDVSGEAV